MQTVGEILRAERVKRGLTIKDIESAISIRALYLDAIEEGNYSIIPGEVYLKGFIRNYATFLGLDPQQVMEVYRQNKGQVTENVPNVNQEETIPVPPSSSGGGLTKWLTIAVVAAGVVAGLVWWSSGSEKTAPAPASPPPAAQQQPEQATQQQAAQSTSPIQSVSPVKPATKVIVTAKYNAQCWTQIIADGKEIYEGTPKNGESFTWEATNKLTAKFGNASAVDLVYNGSVVGKIGGSGEVVTKTFTLSGITQ
ncbi:helix-turn-helix domain-containing protein [Sporomusa sp.]|uniref:helix-turn-helix domain-containing protein n=1 Tax=Sporomusa sp. TaxID=2078658 RepID=UPI002B7EDAF6|nr:helix-turn-helix domain-containing protein [Sporomusa sp.]HWR43092.1 helix-turn-helix domain-containing protein [Sporomusa sp.]